MAVVVVGGNSRSIGKTSVVASLIAALPEMHWTAFKVTQHGHLLCDGSGRSCNCMPPGHTVELTEETNRTSGKDSARFLYAGAVKSFLLRTKQGSLPDAMPMLKTICETAENLIIESNGVMEFLRPELYLVVLDPNTSDFKASTSLYLDRADAIVWRSGASARRQAAWPHETAALLEGKQKFVIAPPESISEELVAFVRHRLMGREKAHPRANR